VSPRQRFYLFGQNGIGAALVNAAINWALGWAMTRHLARLPMWGMTSVGTDLLGTAFGVTFGTCLVMALQVRRDLTHGRISPVALSGPLEALVGRFPQGVLRRGLGLGALSVPVFALPVVAALAASGVHAMDRVPFLVLKSSFSAVEGAIVTPLIVLAALSGVSVRVPQTAPAP